MNTPRLCWRAASRAFQPRPSACPFQNLQSSQRRCVSYAPVPGSFQMPSITQDDSRLIKHGIPGLYSPQGFQSAWTSYQHFLLREMNARLDDDKSTALEGENGLKQIISSVAADQHQAALFNFASTAWNNFFFIRGVLTGDQFDSASMPDSIANRIAQSDFYTVENLKAEFLAQAKAMFGPGFVWLVLEDRSRPSSLASISPRQLYILRTYGAGSPLSGAHFRAQFEAGKFQFGDKATEVATKMTSGRGATLDVVPLLCVSTWEHSYMTDYQVDGRDKYLEAWWSKINWNRVAEISEVENFSPRHSSPSRPSFGNQAY